MISGTTLVTGHAEGPTIFIDPLSFWGGYDPVSGLIIDRSHPACGQTLSGRVLIMRGGRGSSSSSTVLAEAIRRGTAPLAIVLSDPDPILAIGAAVAGALYNLFCPVILVAAEERNRLEGARYIEVRGGRVGATDALIRIKAGDAIQP